MSRLHLFGTTCLVFLGISPLSTARAQQGDEKAKDLQARRNFENLIRVREMLDEEAAAAKAAPRIFRRMDLPAKGVAPQPPKPRRFVASRQFLGEARQPVRAAKEEDSDDEDVIPRAPGRIDVILSAANYDRWIFGNMLTDDQRREWLVLVLNERVEMEVRDHKLTAEQAEKLRLAGRGDIKRFYERVEVERVRFEEVRLDSTTAGVKFLNDLLPLCRSFEKGPYGEGSIFEKTLQTLVRRKSAAAPIPRPHDRTTDRLEAGGFNGRLQRK
jgi:hypothetical protein